MKPILFKHAIAMKDSFFALHETLPHFYDKLHYHPEYQLTFIVEGEGTFFIGDHIERFVPGDFFIIGPNIPHVFRSDNEYYEKGNCLKTEAFNIYFSGNSFGDDFFMREETEEIHHLMKELERGIKINSHRTKDFEKLFREAHEQKGVKKIAALLNLLSEVSRLPKKERVPLASLGFIDGRKVDNNDKMSKAFAYLMENFTKEIRLEHVAAIACMSPTAFCRFFKKRTRKSLVGFILDARVGYACKLLLEENYSISEIAYQCGFRNISNFNRQFRKIAGKTPTEYLEVFRKNNVA